MLTTNKLPNVTHSRVAVSNIFFHISILGALNVIQKHKLAKEGKYQ